MPPVPLVAVQDVFIDDGLCCRSFGLADDIPSGFLTATVSIEDRTKSAISVISASFLQEH